VRLLRISHSSVVTAWRHRDDALRRAGLDVATVTARVWEEGGAPVPLTVRPGEDVTGVATLGRHPCGFVYDPLGLWRALRRVGPEVVELHEEPYSLAAAETLVVAALAGRAGRAPWIVYTAQNLDKRRRPPISLLQRAVLARAAAMYPCNESAAAILRRHGYRGLVRTVPLGVDPAPTPASASPPRSAGRRRVGFAGRLVEEKGVEVLIEAVAAEPAWDLSIAGDGPLGAALAERAAAPDLAGRVEMVGSLGSAALRSWFAGIDVLAVPSKPAPGWVEQFGRVVIEAWAAAVPVVASDSGALAEVIGDAGVLVDPGDPVALRAGLASVLDDPATAAALVARGRARLPGFTWDAVAELERALLVAARDRSPAPLATPGPLPALEVVLVAYGRPDLVEAALRSVSSGPEPLPVIVVDNSSSPAVRAVTLAAGARYHDPGANLGFARAVNLGISLRADPGADVLLLNPDAEIDPGSARELQRRAHAETRVAAAAPAQIDGDGRAQRVAWPFPTPARAWVIAAGLGRWLRAEEFLIGSVLVLRAAALAEVGGFDEAFFLYAEETDWQRRARDAGWGVRYCPDLVARHLGAATSEAGSERREDLFLAGQERYVRKWHGAAGWTVFRIAATAGAAARAAARPSDPAHRARVRRYVRGPMRLAGQYDTA
jgi:GT2 family glycosyltransferase/glycosyltransferase involved in cell wall biosynthesis